MLKLCQVLFFFQTFFLPLFLDDYDRFLFIYLCPSVTKLLKVKVLLQMPIQVKVKRPEYQVRIISDCWNSCFRSVQYVTSSYYIAGVSSALLQSYADPGCVQSAPGNSLAPPAMLQFAKTRKLSVERSDPRKYGSFSLLPWDAFLKCLWHVNAFQICSEYSCWRLTQYSSGAWALSS